MFSQIRLERQEFDLPDRIRERSEEFARRSLALLFPHFRTRETQAPDLVAEFEALCHLGQEVISPLLGPNQGDCGHIYHCFAEALPRIREELREDAEWMLQTDPAAESLDEVILCYPGFLAIAVYRIAHFFYAQQVPIFPRLLGEFAHRETGVEIHPGAQIATPFSIDHGGGVVIGETAVIGPRARIYQGVTLGALAVKKRLAGTKRHPTLEEDVVLYAGATILGGDTVVGAGSIIGGNVWLTESVPPRSIVSFQPSTSARADDAIEYHI